MQILTIGLIGTNEISNIERCRYALEDVIRDILKLCINNSEITFVVSELNEFSIIATSIIKTFRRNLKLKRCFIELCLPYETAKYKENKDFYNEVFDGIVFAGTDYCKGYCKAMIDCSVFMMKRCNFFIFYSETIQGITWDIKKIADEKGFPYIDISKRGYIKDCIFV